MARRRAAILAGCASLWALAVGLNGARGETFELRGGGGPSSLSGRILAELDDYFFVDVDGEAPCFLARSEVLAVQGGALADGSQRLREPPPGSFLRLEPGPTPLGAITAWLDEVRVVDGLGGGEGDPPALSDPWSFVRAGQRVRTGELGLARLALLDGGVLHLKVESQLSFSGAPGQAEVSLDYGFAELEAGPEPLTLRLWDALTLTATARSRLSAEGERGRERGGVRLAVHQGDANLAWTDLQVQLGEGAGLEIVPAGAGSWRLSAGGANPDPLEVRHEQGVDQLQPGETRIYGARTGPVQASWRLRRSQGPLQLQRAGESGPTPVDPDQRQRLTLGSGDRLLTGARATAELTRVDGALATLGQLTTLSFGAGDAQDDALLLEKGELALEVLDTLLPVDGPAGVAAMRETTVRLRRRADGALEARSTLGSARLALGPWAGVNVGPGQAVEITGTPREARVQATSGAPRLTTQEGPGGFDPRLEVALEPALPLTVQDTERGPLLRLPQERQLLLTADELDCELVTRRGQEALERPELSLKGGSLLRLEQGLFLELGKRRGLPELRFKTGERLALASPLAMRVENPTVVVDPPRKGQDGPSTTLELLGGVAARLEQGEDGQRLAVRLREEDRLEVPLGWTAELDQGSPLFAERPDQPIVKFALREGSREPGEGGGDGLLTPRRRRVWIEQDAPQGVQARLDPEQALFVSMPQAPTLEVPRGARSTVLATANGELFFLDASFVPLAGEEPLQGARPVIKIPPIIFRQRQRDLPTVPPVDSPSGP